MLNIHTLVLGDYQVNCYLIHAADSRRCAVIDPGYDAQVILSKAEALGLTLDAILLTHGHFDHTGAVKALIAATGCSLYMSRQDWQMPLNPNNQFLFPLAQDTFTDVSFCQEGDTIHTAGLTLQVLATPGHTQGSVCYLCDQALFTGDTLFAGCCGRTDLPGGSAATIRESLSRLNEISENYTVYPGHGESSTLAQEKRYNPYLR